MRELVETLAGWRAEGADIGRAVVVRSFGSAPRPEGAVLLATADGRIAGSVSGGCVEGAAVEEIARARSTGRSRVIRYGISDELAWSVGLACGGTIDVLVEPLVRAEAEAAARATAGATSPGEQPAPSGAPSRSGQPAPGGGPAGTADDFGVAGTSGGVARAGASVGRAVVTPLPPDSPGPAFGPHETGDGEAPAPVVVVWGDGRLEGSLGDPALDTELARLAIQALERGTSMTVELGDRSLFVEAYPVRPRLVVVGAVQVAIPLVAIARTLGYETVVVDGRAAFATSERFPDVDRLVVGWPDEVADQIGLGPADTVAVLSHDVKFDEPAIATALRRGCRYVGAVGSRKTQVERRARLRDAGLSDADLGRLRGPIGLDLGGRAPAEVALAVMAEVVAARYAGTARPMRDLAAEREAADRKDARNDQRDAHPGEGRARSRPGIAGRTS